MTVNRLGSNWSPGVLIPDKFTQSSELPRDMLSIKLPITDSLAQSFMGDTQDVVTKLTIWRTHYDETDALFQWKGRVSSTNFDGVGTMTLECEPVFSSLRRVGLAPLYSRSCRHVLFGQGCQLNRADFAQSGTVSAVANGGDTITVAEAAAQNLVGGTILAGDGSIQMITAQNGAVLTLMRRVPYLAAQMIAHPSGFSIDFYTGCDHSFTTCDVKFGNLGNFGAFVGIPTMNPFGPNNIFV